MTREQKINNLKKIISGVSRVDEVFPSEMQFGETYFFTPGSDLVQIESTKEIISLAEYQKRTAGMQLITFK